MKTGKGVAVMLLVVTTAAVAVQQDEFPLLTGQYFGQTPPWLTPEVFAPGIISTEVIEASLTFSFDDRFLVFRRGFREDTEIYLAENKAELWSEPVRAPFFDKQYRFGDFTFSPNEPVLYFTSDRPLQAGQPKAESSNIWTVEYDQNGWLTPTPVDGGINTSLHESYPSVSNTKILFFFRRFDAENSNYEIMFSEFKNGGYSEPTRMGAEINTQWEEWDPAIAPDGSFLVFCSKKPSGFGRDDLYVAFRSAAGGWSKAVNLGNEVNSEESENRPFITADGKYLFYNKSADDRRDVYWVDLGVVQKLRPINQ